MGDENRKCSELFYCNYKKEYEKCIEKKGIKTKYKKFFDEIPVKKKNNTSLDLDFLRFSTIT